MSEARTGRTIATRVFSLVGLGMLAPLTVMVWAGVLVFKELDRHTVAEKERVASLTARRLDAVLNRELQALHEAGKQVAARMPPPAVVRDLRARRREVFDEHFVLDARGEVVSRDPANGAPLDGRLLVEEVRRAGRAFLSDARPQEDGPARVYAVVPVFDEQHELLGVVGGGTAIGGARLQAVVATPGLVGRESVDAVDGEGTTVASTDATRVGLHTPHSARLVQLMRQRRAGTGTCDDCRAADTERELYAFSPLASVHWGVSARQPVADAWAFVGTLLRNTSLLAVGLVTLALLFAWGAALSVTRPVALLTKAAERISSGELDTPIPGLPADEVGRLGAALEAMRCSLSSSVKAIAQANVALEARVAERTQALAAVNAELEERERARTRLLRQVITAQEAERKRIARELHDETCQSLATVMMGLQSAAADLPGEARHKVEEASRLAERSLAEVHRLIIDLRPSVLDDLGLQSAIEWYADRALKPRGLTVRCEFSGLEARLPHEVETVLFRVAQEAMTNVARHARADTVLIQCTARDGLVTLEVEDDGEGFEPRALGAPDDRGRGLGLLGMRERVELFGGTMTLDSAPGQGTHLTLTVPLRAAEKG